MPFADGAECRFVHDGRVVIREFDPFTLRRFDGLLAPHAGASRFARAICADVLLVAQHAQNRRFFPNERHGACVLMPLVFARRHALFVVQRPPDV